MPSSGEHTLPDQLSVDQAEAIAQTFSALSDPTRLRIIYALIQGEKSVNALAEMGGVSASAVSHHLARLRDLHLVESHRVANQVFYSVDDLHVESLFHEAINHLDHVRDGLPPGRALQPLKAQESSHGG